MPAPHPATLRRRLPGGPLRHLSLLLLAALPALACSSGAEPTGAERAAGAAGMEDVTAAAGLDFHHHNGMTGELYFSEMMGSGAALLDADGDGDLDLYLVQGGPLAPRAAGDDPGPGDRLYRNDPQPGAPGFRFVDVTAESGLAAYGYGMGVAVGDVDGDGLPDLYVTNFGANQLWHNQGPGPDGEITFRDVTAAAGVDDPRWSTSAAFFDYDRDGRLDLYVTSYTDFRLANHKPCTLGGGRVDYCSPKSYEPESDRLFRNLGPSPDGTPRFADVSATAGILAVAAAGLGVVTGDFDGDGWIDVYVANDQDRNLLWINDRTGGFVDRGLVSGSATNLAGVAESSMGVDAGDFDSDGDEDLFVTHLDSETNTFYLSSGDGLFRDATVETRLGPVSLGFTGFGTAFFDLENDGWLDLAAVNGAVLLGERDGSRPHPGAKWLGQPNQLFANRGDGAEGRRVFDAGPSAGSPWTDVATSRGLAVGDLDNDGDADLVVTNNDGPARVLANRHDPGDAWLGLRLVDAAAGRDQLGARVTLRRPGAPDLLRVVRTGGSYLSARDPRVIFGLAGGGELGAIEVVWPDGAAERWPPPAPGRYTTLVQGTGEPLR